MKRSLSALLLALASLAIAAAPAHAWTELLTMDVPPENVGWWPLVDGGGTSVLNGGILTLTATSYREYWAPGSWISTVNIATGYTIEFRMRIVSESQCYPDREVGLWYYDNTYLTIVSIDPDRIYVHYPTSGQPSAALDATLWHTYRIVVLGTHHLIYVDGALAIDFQHPGTGDGSHIFSFGDLGACGYSQSQWDYVGYDTDAVVPAARTTWGRLKTLYRGER